MLDCCRGWAVVWRTGAKQARSSLASRVCCANGCSPLPWREDVNDHEVLRDDLVLQTACGEDRRLASPSTVGRLERAADRSWAWAAHETQLHRLLLRRRHLDDCTDDAVISTPTPSPAAAFAWAWPVEALRQAWPAVRLTVRADSGFCRHKMLSWCERHEVGYIVGLAKNARINDQAARGMALAAAAYERTGDRSGSVVDRLSHNGGRDEKRCTIHLTIRRLRGTTPSGGHYPPQAPW